MLTTTDTWKDAAGRVSPFSGTYIVVLEDGGAPLGYHYFSTEPIVLDGTIQCHPSIVSIGELIQEVNLNSFAVNLQSITIEAAAIPREKTPDTYTGLDFLSADIGHTVTERLYDGTVLQIYLYPGPPVLTLSDCLLVFRGNVVSIDYSSAGTVTFIANEIDLRKDFAGWTRSVPMNTLSRIAWPDLPTESEGDSVPIVYGRMDEKSDPVTTNPTHLQTGFAIARLIKRDPEDWHFLIADHVCDSLDGTAWIYIPQLDCWARNYSNIEYSRNWLFTGKARARINLITAEWRAYLPPTYVYHGSSSTAVDAKTSLVTDGDLTTYFSVLAHSSTEAAFYMEWHQKGDPADDAILNGIGAFVHGTCYLNLKHTPTSGGITSRKLQFWHNGSWIDIAWPATPTDPDGVYYRFSLTSYNWTSATNGTFWHLASGTKGGDGVPTRIRLLFTGSGFTANSTVVAVIYQAWLQPPRFKLARIGMNQLEKPSTARQRSGRRAILNENYAHAPSRDFPPAATQPLSWSQRNAIADFQPTNFIGFECGGREFGGWIGRGARTHSNGDLIEYPGDVIESLLRNELGAVTDDIDTLAFDRVSEDDGLHPLTGLSKCYLNMPAGKSMPAKSLCERIGWEHSLFVFRRRNGQFSAVDYFGTYDVKATIEPEHTVAKYIPWNMHTPETFCNAATLLHTRLPVNESFNRSIDAYDSISIIDYGETEKRIVEFDTLRQSTIDGDTDPTVRFKKRVLGLAGAYGGQWSRPMLYLEIQTVGWRYAALEIGDSVKFSSEWGKIQIYPLKIASKFWQTDMFVVYGVAIKSHSVILKLFNWKGFNA